MCKVNAQKICGNPECEICFKKSFASYRGKTKKGKLKIECWNCEKNNGITPYNISKGKNKKYWFCCDNCPHDFLGYIASITSKNQTWCPYCCKSSQQLCDNKKCEFCYGRSFVSYKRKTKNGNLIVDYWDKSNKVSPRDIFKISGKKYCFQCDNCPHKFRTSIASITTGKETWCPYCCIPCQKLCDDEKCDFCFNNSFASYKGRTNNDNLKVLCFDESNELNPRQIFKNSNKKYIFKCDECHDKFPAAMDKITSRWCPYCKNKTEKIFKKYFIKNYPQYRLKHQPKYEWCTNENTGRCFPFDFVVEELKIIIEIDGEQHFRQVSNWVSFENTQKRDFYKMQKAKNNLYTMIRIIREDIWFNKNNWKKILEKVLIKHNKPALYCIGCDIKYKNYIDQN